MPIPSPGAPALRATASRFDDLRDNLPVLEDSFNSLDSHSIADQLSELGSLIGDVADQVLIRTVDRKRSGGPAPALAGFAAAVRPASNAASALAFAAHRFSELEQAGSLHDTSGALDYDRLVMGHALATADKALRVAADSLRDAAATPSPEAARSQAARNRSTAASPAPSLPLLAAAPPAVPPARIVRGQ
ncbi:hypothetical protein ACIPWL_28330 [Streptomyces sp. NPDC090023]|uniref:hypothetical protein n=1 Tax=unclassified Streptomyces TaxID=2593676 RepID=UPI00381715C9